jgi:hypothetical protein
MTALVALAGPLRWLATRRRREIESSWRDPGALQETTLRHLVRRARRTAWGRAHGFEDIRGVAGYQARVPLADYPALQPSLQRAIAGEPDVLWPGCPRLFCKTSGTTAGDKLIPLTPEALRAHRRGGLDTLLVALDRAGAPRALDGPLLFLGGSTSIAPLGAGARVGDLSGLVVRRLPWWLRGHYSPGPEIAAIPHWEARLEAIARLARTQDLRLVSGMPSWLLVLFERIRALGSEGAWGEPLGRLWPNLAVLVHGGVRIDPYRTVLETAIGRPVHRVEVYPASEGFVGIQLSAGDPGFTLMLDYGTFFEFVPVADLDAARPRRLTVAEVRIGEAYAIALTTPAGLWSYLLGDTVRFVSLDPPQLVITGRTRHFVNAFGENVIVEEVERAAAAACQATGAELVEFTVAPSRLSSAAPRGHHEWLVEFRRPPATLAAFGRSVDQALQALNTDYRTRRARDVGMAPPRITPVSSGTFHRWLAARGQLGDQHKVPRVTNSRLVLEEVLGASARFDARQPLPAALVPSSQLVLLE